MIDNLTTHIHDELIGRILPVWQKHDADWGLIVASLSPLS
jgi:hypothetical protein